MQPRLSGKLGSRATSRRPAWPRCANRHCGPFARCYRARRLRFRGRFSHRLVEGEQAATTAAPLHETAQGTHRELDRLATDALRAAARQNKRLVDRTLAAQVCAVGESAEAAR